MFRTSALRSASRAAVAAALRPAARSTSMFAAAAPRAVAAPVAVRAQSFVPVRMYSAGGGLKKEEVEGRIMSLLQGFDKVRVFFVGVWRQRLNNAVSFGGLRCQFGTVFGCPLVPSR